MEKLLELAEVRLEGLENKLEGYFSKSDFESYGKILLEGQIIELKGVIEVIKEVMSFKK